MGTMRRIEKTPYWKGQAFSLSQVSLVGSQRATYIDSIPWRFMTFETMGTVT